MEWPKLCTEENLNMCYKYVANLAQRIAYNLGNTASQTEVKILSCIPIDVTDLHRRIFELEIELEKAILEKKLAEKEAKAHVPTQTPEYSEIRMLRETNYPMISSCNCIEVPLSVSCGNPACVFSKENSRKSRKEKPIKFNKCKRSLYKGFGSFFKESGMCHGDRLRENASKESSDRKSNEFVNIDYCHLEPIQYCQMEPARLLNPTTNQQLLDIIKDENKNTFQDSPSIQRTSEQLASEHNYLEPIAECCRLEATLAFHHMESFTQLQAGDGQNGDKLLKNRSSLYKQQPASEVRNLTTTCDWYSTDTIKRQPQTENTCEGGNPISQTKSHAPNCAKNIFITECVNPPNISKQIDQGSISDSQHIEATLDSLGLPNTEPKRGQIPKHYSSQGTQQSLLVTNAFTEHHRREGLSPTVSCNRETQAPTIDSCSCCFFKQLTTEQLVDMPRGPLKGYLYDQQSSSSSTCADCNHFEQKGRIHRRNANKIKKTEYANRRHKPKISMIQSSSSQYSVPVCCDEDSESCSCFPGGVFYDIDLVNCSPQLDNFDTSNSSNHQYYDDKLYDIIPVRENNKKTKSDKKEIQNCHQKTHLSRNDVIVNYHTLQGHKLQKKPIHIDTSNKTNISFDYMRTSRQKKIPKINYAISNNQAHVTKRTATLPIPNPNHTGCQTDLNTEAAENEGTKPAEKHDAALSQIKQTLQYVLDKFRPYTHRDTNRKDAILQVENCQCDQNYRIPYNETFMKSQTKPTFIQCGPQVTPATIVYPTMPILTSPWINAAAMFVQPNRNPHPQTKSPKKSSFGAEMSILHEENSLLPEKDKHVGGVKDKSTGNNSSNDKNNRKISDVCEQTILSNDLKPQGLIETIIISRTNIAKKCKNKKIYCCISNHQSIKNFKKSDDIKCIVNEEPAQNKIPLNAKYTGSTVNDVVEELNKMEEYITRSEYRIGDEYHSKGSLEKPNKKLTDVFRSIKNVFKTRNKNRKIAKRRSCDTVAEDEAKGFCLSSVHLLYPTKKKFRIPCKQNRSKAIPLMPERCSYVFYNKKCLKALGNSKRKSPKIFY